MFKKITSSFAILDLLESLFSCRKSQIRLFLVLPLTIRVYCLCTTSRHVTEFIRGHVYWPYSINFRTCTNSVYQALLSHPLEPGYEASVCVTIVEYSSIIEIDGMGKNGCCIECVQK